MLLRFNDLKIDPADHTAIPSEGNVWLADVQQFCRFWFSGEKIWRTKTSGSESTPKPVLLSRDQLEFSARLSLEFFKFDPQKDGFALAVPASAAGGFMLLARAFLAGIDVALLAPDWMKSTALSLPEDKKWFLPLLPNQFYDLLSRPETAELSRRLTGILIGGGSIGESTMAATRSLHCPVWHSYGMTETASHIALRRIFPENPQEGFRPLQGVQIRTDENNCLEIKASVLTGYQWLKTKDLAEILPDGSFHILGRADFIVNSGGLKIRPEIEKAVLAGFLPPDTGAFDLIGIPDERLGEKLVMVCYSESVSLHKIPGILAEIRDTELRKRLPKALYVFPGGPPLLPSGKTDFRFLREKIPAIFPRFTFQA